MAEQSSREPRVKLPDLSGVEEKGISIDAPTPTQFTIPDPWNPQSGNGGVPAPAPSDPGQGESTEPGSD